MCLELKKLQLLWQKLALQMKMLSFKTPYYTQFSIFPSEPKLPHHTVKVKFVAWCLGALLKREGTQTSKINLKID